MKERIPLQINEGRLVLTSVIECPSLRISRQIMDFVIDTGSADSFISDKDTRRLQIPIKGKSVQAEVDFGGSRFSQVTIPPIKIYLLKEDKEKGYHTLTIRLSALKTTKLSERKIQAAQTLPSILGLNFLKEHKISLHVILTENLAYMEFEQ